MTNWFSRETASRNAIAKQTPVPADWMTKLALPKGAGLLTSGVRWLRERYAARTSPRRLHLEETISLGQKRFVSVVAVDQRRFLVGGGASELSMLADLSRAESFSSVLETATQALEPVAAPAGNLPASAATVKAATRAYQRQAAAAEKVTAAKPARRRAKGPRTEAQIMASITTTINAMARASEPAPVQRYAKRLDALLRELGEADSKTLPSATVQIPEPVALPAITIMPEHPRLEVLETGISAFDIATQTPELIAVPPRRGLQSVRSQVESSEKCA